MNKPFNLCAGLVAGLAVLLSAPAALAHTVADAHHHARVQRHAPLHHAAPVRHDYRHDYRHDRHHARQAVPARAYRDRDGDGVPNRFDMRPDNPRRY